MCATLQRLNQHSDNEEQAQPDQAEAPSPATDQPGDPQQDGEGASPAASDSMGAMFVMPSGPDPTEIPGFPFPRGEVPAPATPGLQAPQVDSQAGGQRPDAVSPLPVMPILGRPQSHGPAGIQHPQTQGHQSLFPTSVNSERLGLNIIPGSVLDPPQPDHPAPARQGGHPQAGQIAQVFQVPPQGAAPATARPQQGYTLGRLQGQGRTLQTPPSGLSPSRLNLSMLGNVATDQLSTGYLDPYDAWFPEPRTIAETGINQGMITDLVLKALYFTSYMSGQDISASLRLPFYGVIDQIVNIMKKEQLCDVSGASGLGEAGYQYILTVKGMERAHQTLQRSSYLGPAPVPLARYIDLIKLESTNRGAITKPTVERCLKGMVLSQELANQVGAAVNAGKSLFLFGAPGNGKTLLAEKIAAMLGGNIAIPYALEADGQIIQLFDLNSHQPAVPKGMNDLDSTKAELRDRRWVRIRRPVVVVGGELTMNSLDLVYNETAGFYEAPFQLKANGGLFLIDDFGRQQVSPQALLNRWIVPLEKGIDFLTLRTGKKLQVPFELFLVLSTNLQPEELVDEAFLRRIQNKLFVPDPTPQQFYEIFLNQCKTVGVPFDQHGLAHLVTKHYRETSRPFRGSHPRDLLRQLLGLAKYLNVPPELTPQLLDAACASYFVSQKKKQA